MTNGPTHGVHPVADVPPPSDVDTPHEISLAIWEIPSPVVAGERFTIKAGAKSSADCDLHGRRIEVCDATGAVIGFGRLDETPWPGTSALYWTELDLPAPAREGMASLSVRFQAAGLDLPHEDASSQFSVMAVRPPEHTLTIKVVDKETATPVEDALIRLGVYRATTDGSGFAAVRMPKGKYELHLWKVGYAAPPTAVAIDNDRSIEVEMATAPEENGDLAWQM